MNIETKYSRTLRPWREKVGEARMRGYSLGFTLMEILVAVLIIGILGAIALPQYQRAVLKSRFAALMPIAKSLADSNEVYYLDNGEYADNAQDLPIQGRQNYPDGTKWEFGTTSEYSYVLATRGEDFPNHYIVYQKHSGKFPDNIHCEAAEKNDMAKEVCVSLGGQPIEGSLKDGYLTYVLSGMRTEKDKFPSSLSKLAATICADVAPDDCIIDDKARTITTRTCSAGNVRFTKPGAQSSSLYGTAGGCTGTSYDADGNEAGRYVFTCSAGAVVNEAKTHCENPISTGSYESRDMYDEEGYKQQSRYCREIQDDQCVTTTTETTDKPNDSPTYFRHKRTCATAAMKDDGTCSAYPVVTGGDAAYLNNSNEYDRRGHNVWYVGCTHRDPDGTCTSMHQGYIKTYADDGTTQTGSISVSCTVSHYNDTNPCTGYSLTYSGNATGPATCPANRLNFDTFECAPESAG